MRCILGMRPPPPVKGRGRRIVKMAEHTLLQAKQKGLPMWYVIQVRTGTEADIQRQCEKILSPGALSAASSPGASR